MPAIWFGTVILWTEVKQEKQKGAKQKKQEGHQKKAEVTDKVVSSDLRTRGMYKSIKHQDTKHINIYLPDDDIESDAVKPKIVAKYIAEKKKQELWEAYGKGLLQVVDIDKTTVTPPRIPWDDQ